jgi:hypothetical protein
MSYNGWKNRETWLVNIWFGDMFQMELEDGIEITASYIEDVVTDYVNDILPSASFIVDMMDMGAIDWDELASHYETEEEVVEG